MRDVKVSYKGSFRIIQGVHKISLQFQKFITKATDEILRQICSMYSVVIKVFITLHFRYPVDE